MPWVSGERSIASRDQLQMCEWDAEGEICVQMSKISGFMAQPQQEAIVAAGRVGSRGTKR